MDNDEYQLLYFLANVKKYLSNLCDSCIDEICDSTVQKVLMTRLEPNKKIETYIKLIKEKRNKIECEYRNQFEDYNDSKDNIPKNILKSESENNSHLSDCDGNCGISSAKIDMNLNKNLKSPITINSENAYQAKKTRGNKKKKKRNAT